MLTAVAQSRPVDAAPQLVSLLRPLGSGSNGSVYLGRLSTGETVAVKRTPLCSQEHAILEHLHHPNIIGIRGSIACPPHRLLLLEHIDDGVELFTLINRGRLSGGLIQEIFGQLLLVLAYLHDHQQLVHGDLKPENILVAMCHGRPVVKLIDFGLCRPAGGLCAGLWGSLEYAPPEMRPSSQPRHYDPVKAEMWSLGVVLFTMVYRTLPCEHEGPLLSEHEDSLSSCPLTDAICALMQPDPGQRPTCRALYDRLAAGLFEERR